MRLFGVFDLVVSLCWLVTVHWVFGRGQLFLLDGWLLMVGFVYCMDMVECWVLRFGSVCSCRCLCVFALRWV